MGSRFRVERVSCFVFRVGSDFRVQGLGFRIKDLIRV